MLLKYNKYCKKFQSDNKYIKYIRTGSHNNNIISTENNKDNRINKINILIRSNHRINEDKKSI